ncbi:hypothetical protein POSPLADRAFT_1050779 [Postia placenta MAD-698-R-SB12]|uniref:Uncharacterized protein n=1 Tax=Postia placenta MAD-698-R-SB12 TaxID=670580 RepID=A0A1X6MIJ5_9APHY|nr:hypothetical protein POSPLADRAFT_1050779 [Postia placenta MAD-698-R-SB12]OSX56257.1 hypothetical protein POSPLADRAFT_1050779 [Postia placenta MAD-698-R-SB12]
MSNTIVPHPQLTIPAQPGLQHQRYQLITWKIEGYNGGQDPGEESQQPLWTVMVLSSLPPSPPLREQGDALTILETREPSDAQINDLSRSLDHDMLDPPSDRGPERGVVPSSGRPTTSHRKRTSRRRDAPSAQLNTQGSSSSASPDPVMQELRRSVRTTLFHADIQNRFHRKSETIESRQRHAVQASGHIIRTTGQASGEVNAVANRSRQSASHAMPTSGPGTDDVGQDNIRQTPCLDMPDLNEPRVEDSENVGRMPRDRLPPIQLGPADRAVSLPFGFPADLVADSDMAEGRMSCSCSRVGFTSEGNPEPVQVEASCSHVTKMIPYIFP